MLVPLRVYLGKLRHGTWGVAVPWSAREPANPTTLLYGALGNHNQNPWGGFGLVFNWSYAFNCF